MRRLIVVLSPLLFAAHASAADFRNADALHEAREFLADCGEAKDRDRCHFTQSEFLEEYQNAYARDHLAQINIAYVLWSGLDGAVRKNLLEACAWSHIAAASPEETDIDRERGKRTCTEPYESSGPVLDDELADIRSEMRQHRVQKVPVPEIGFDPAKEKNEGD